MVTHMVTPGCRDHMFLLVGDVGFCEKYLYEGGLLNQSILLTHWGKVGTAPTAACCLVNS